MRAPVRVTHDFAVPIMATLVDSQSQYRLRIRADFADDARVLGNGKARAPGEWSCDIDADARFEDYFVVFRRFDDGAYGCRYGLCRRRGS